MSDPGSRWRPPEGTVAWLHCASCGHEQPLGPAFWGCPECTARGARGMLEVQYAPTAGAEAWRGWPARTRRGAPTTLWDHPGLLPPVGAAHRRSLGEGGTPLLRLDALCRAAGFDDLYVKNEASNPTWAHKDRFHAVAVAMAADLGFARVVASTTGNHGASLAAYAALHGRRALVLCHQATPPLLTDLMRAYGAAVVQTDEHSRGALLRTLVAQHGWYPATGVSALGPVNPYGVEGYKTIAYEIVEGLGSAPAHVIVPTAGGDALYGIWKGLRELHAAGHIARLPRLHAGQPASVAPLVRAYEQGLPEIVELPAGQTRALSIADRIGGSHALAAVRASGGTGIAVSEDEITEAQELLAGCGIAAETASAATLAGALQQGRRLTHDQAGAVVCVLTSAAIKWPPEVAGLRKGPLLPGLTDVAALAAQGLL